MMDCKNILGQSQSEMQASSLMRMMVPTCLLVKERRRVNEQQHREERERESILGSSERNYKQLSRGFGKRRDVQKEVKWCQVPMI